MRLNFKNRSSALKLIKKNKLEFMRTFLSSHSWVLDHKKWQNNQVQKIFDQVDEVYVKCIWAGRFKNYG